MVSVAVFCYNPDEDNNMDLISGRKNIYIVIYVKFFLTPYSLSPPTLIFIFTLFLKFYFLNPNDDIFMIEKLFYKGFLKFDM